jgi:hypothetical protein
MSCCPLLAWRSTSRSWAERRWAWYSTGASPRCTLNSYRPEGKARPGLPGGEHLRRGYALQRAAAVGQGPDARAPGRRWSPSPVEALSSSSSTRPAGRAISQPYPHAGREALGNTELGASAVRVAQQTPSGLRGSGSASALERARTRFNYYGPLLRLGPLQDAGELLQASAPGGLRKPLVRRSWTRRGSRRSSSGGDPYRMSISLSAAAASRIARRSAASGFRDRFRRPAQGPGVLLK